MTIEQVKLEPNVRLVSTEHPENIAYASVSKVLVKLLRPTTVVNLEQLRNISFIDVTFSVVKPEPKVTVNNSGQV